MDASKLFFSASMSASRCGASGSRLSLSLTLRHCAEHAAAHRLAEAAVATLLCDGANRALGAGARAANLIVEARL